MKKYRLYVYYTTHDQYGKPTTMAREENFEAKDDTNAQEEADRFLVKWMEEGYKTIPGPMGTDRICHHAYFHNIISSHIVKHPQ